MSAPGPESHDGHEQRGDRYTLLRQLGSGGFGTVHLAYDRVLQREVALKELRRDLVEPGDPAASDLRARLLREVQVTSQLEHPGIVPVYDLDEDADEANSYYTMRVVRGQPLEDAIARHHERRHRGDIDPLELPRLLNALVGICNAIGYAHARGVMHRDLKPGNVVLGEFGEVVLLDWGLAKVDHGREEPAASPGTAPRLSTDSPHESVAGAAVGTPAYMAPEQARGEPGDRTDVYGLGAILFELLTGHAPHKGEDSAAVLERILLGATPRAREAGAFVPAALDAVCARAMSRDPQQRYANPAELADELRRFLADEPVDAFAEHLTARIWRWMRRHRTWTLAAAAIAAVTITVTTLAAVLLARISEDERQARMAAERMREQGLRLAAKFAARTVASAVDVRWRVLESSAQSRVLRTRLEALRDTSALQNSTQRAWLQQWLEQVHAEHQPSANATSWFLTDARGRHIARSPFDGTLVGNRFAYRDYFHGQGRDLERDAAFAPPIVAPHRSVVFESKATGNRMVAFSVPIWDAPARQDRSVIGVLAMTVELGAFTALQVDLQGEQVAVLIEMRNDWIGGNEGTGLVLHHPLLAGVSRIDAQLVAELRARAGTTSPGLLLRNHRDPVAPDVPWLAVFEPVFVRNRDEVIEWVVAVQERASAGH